MKVVINACFGGFSLSPEGERAYLAKKGKTPYFYKQTKYSFRYGVNEYTRLDAPENDLFYHTLLKDLGPVFSEFPEGDDLYFSCRDIERNDPDLIAVIEEIGAGHRTGASGQCAELKIVEIPDGTEYFIEEYDGNEHIAEVHQTWR